MLIIYWNPTKNLDRFGVQNKNRHFIFVIIFLMGDKILILFIIYILTTVTPPFSFNKEQNKGVGEEGTNLPLSRMNGNEN